MSLVNKLSRENIMTELIWDGKYDANGRRTAPLKVSLPYQTVETVNESVQQRQQSLDFFNTGRDSEWRNRLIWGDKKYVLPSLLDEFSGKVNLIYIDPPFNVGADFSYTAIIPKHPDTDDDELLDFIKEPSLIEQKAYRDTWGKGLDSYLQWFYESIIILRELLAVDGSIFVHLDWHVSHYAKSILDEVFGIEYFRNEIIWKRKGGSANPQNRLGVVTDSIFWYSKSEKINFNQQYTKDNDEVNKYIEERFNNIDENSGRRFMKSPIVSPNLRPNLKYNYKGYTPPPNGWSISLEIMENWDKEGKLYFPPKGSGDRIYRKIYLDEYVGQPIQNLWTDIYVINPVAHERVNYDTQKPESLLERIINISSNENDLILDCFCGSGTTAVVAERMNRHWIVGDLSRFAIHTTRKRLLAINGIRPFIVQNLGKYERQAWMESEFSPKDAQKKYRDFILSLYNARPVNNSTWLHGIKSGRMVHVGSVDAPVTTADLANIASEFKKSIGTGKDASEMNGIDILGWDFAFELNEAAKQHAAQANLDIRFFRVPRDVMDKRAVEQGDIKFFELAALGVEISKKKLEVNLTLKDFVIPPDDVPQDIQKSIKHWSQWVDYWAVDWDFQGDTFHNQWQTYRTRKDNILKLTAPHIYEHSGEYSIVVKVIDILGNDTTKTLKVAVGK